MAKYKVIIEVDEEVAMESIRYDLDKEKGVEAFIKMEFRWMAARLTTYGVCLLELEKISD